MPLPRAHDGTLSRKKHGQFISITEEEPFAFAIYACTKIWNHSRYLKNAKKNRTYSDTFISVGNFLFGLIIAAWKNLEVFCTIRKPFYDLISKSKNQVAPMFQKVIGVQSWKMSRKEQKIFFMVNVRQSGIFAFSWSPKNLKL